MHINENSYGMPKEKQFRSGIVWNCWTGALAQLDVTRANALQAQNSTGADADLARTRAFAAYKDFLTLWKDADPEIPIYKQAKPEYARARVAAPKAICPLRTERRLLAPKNRS